MGGGYLLDRMGSSLQNAMMLSAASAAVALVACEAAFLLASSFVAFCAVLGVGLLGLFLATAPLCELLHHCFSSCRSRNACTHRIRVRTTCVLYIPFQWPQQAVGL